MNLLKRQKILKELVRETTLKITSKKGLSEVSNAILNDIIFTCLTNYQKKVNIGIQDSVYNLLDNLKQELRSLVFDISEEWSIITSHEKLIFPDNCRFFYKKGQSFIVVIEQKPHVRSLRFDKSILKKFSDDRSFTRSKFNSELIQLSLPYVVFVFHFKNLSKESSSSFFKLKGLYSGWKKSPISSLEDDMYNPLLPNIHTNLNICMGQKWSLKGNNISKLVSDALVDYWSSEFNGDLAEFWWGKRKYDKKFETGYRWAEESKKNPDFILNVNLGSSDKKLSDMINLCVSYEEELDKEVIKHRLNNLIDSCAGNFFDKIMKFFKKTKFERYYPKEVVSVLEKEISLLAEEMSDFILCLDHEIQKLDRDYRNRELANPDTWKKEGTYWS